MFGFQSNPPNWKEKSHTKTLYKYLYICVFDTGEQRTHGVNIIDIMLWSHILYIRSNNNFRASLYQRYGYTIIL